MKVEVICRNHDINEILGIHPMNYQAALKRAFSKIEANEVVSSWKDAFISSDFDFNISEFLEVPSFGCFKDTREKAFVDRDDCIAKVWSIGGENGWYYGSWLWKIRCFLDKAAGGVGLRRGRTSVNSLNAGDVLDFWRVLYANKQEGRLVLFAEMRLPGDAWLEFKIVENKLVQTATFRPLGLNGRLYWFSVFLFHEFIFEGMIRKIAGIKSAGYSK